MEEVLLYVSKDVYDYECTSLIEGESKVIYKDDKTKIRLKKRGKKIFNIIVNYGDKPITEIARNLLLIQA